MTGPAPGKIPINLNVFLDEKRYDCECYIHLKGYSRARVTHLDIEGLPISEEFDGKGVYGSVIGIKDGFTVILFNRINAGDVSFKKIRITGISILKVGEKSSVWVGLKVGGFYIGFKKDVLKRLEELALKLGENHSF